MTKLLQIGCSSAAELHHSVGHTAGTLGGVNYESRGSRGCVRGSSARGAANPLFKHQYYLKLTDAQAAAAKRYADSCIGQPYHLGAVPGAHHGGDCSGYMSGLICAAKGMDVHRLFGTATWPRVYARLGFQKGLNGGVIVGNVPAIGVLDRPYPGKEVIAGSTATGHVRWIQARLNYAAQNHHPELGGAALAGDGQFGGKTEVVLRAFQKHHGLDVDGRAGRGTWRALNAVR